MQTNWNIRELIDLEYFLSGQYPEASDSGEPDADFDRRAYLAFTQAHPATTPPRRTLIRYWLEQRRRFERENRGQSAMLPGTAYSETITLLRVVLAFFGATTGAALVWGLFSYQGRQPINVFTCLWALVVPQLLLLLLLFSSWGLKSLGLVGSVHRISALLGALCRRMILRISRIVKPRMTADTKNRIQSAVGLLGQARTVYGSVFYRPFFLTVQAFGIFFNLGVLVAMLLRVTITDLAFGWQSTLQPDPETVYRVVHAISAPWSWFVSPPIAHPTMAQIAGSKMVLKEGIYHLATRDLIAWWPFLCFAVIFYGLLPRLALAALVWFRQRRALNALAFNHTSCDRLIQRMQTPRVETRSRPYEKPMPPRQAVPSETAATEERPETTAPPLSRTPALVLISAEIVERTDDGEVNGQLNRLLAMDAVETIAVQADIDIDAPGIENALASHQTPENGPRVVVIQEAWQPPIKESLSWLRDLRDRIGKTRGLVVALIGKPATHTLFTLPADTDRLIWEQAVKGLGDPYTRVETLGG